MDEWDRVLEYLFDVVFFNGVFNFVVYFFMDIRFKMEVCGFFVIKVVSVDNRICN